MRFLRVLPVILLGTAAICAPAAAQMYPGQDVSVNPTAMHGGAQVLLYPGGKYIRVVPQLLQPGQAFPGTEQQPIHLHMPTPHRHVVRARAPQPDLASAPSAPVAEAPPPEPAEAPMAAPTEKVASPAPLPPAKQKIAKPAVAAQAPVAAPSDDTASQSAPGAAIPFSFGGPMGAGAKPQRSKTETAPSPKAEAAPAAAQTKIASTEPAPVTTLPSEEGPNLTKRSEILFPHNATDPTPQSAGSLKQLAGVLNSALNAGALRVQLDAFGGAPGDKSTDARRVSLKRALVIRQLLIDAGVPASRIDVRAMGGIDDSGNADRVDVYVRAG